MRTDRVWRFRIGAALVLPWVLASCSEPVTPDPHAEIRGTYDLVLIGGSPLPAQPAQRGGTYVVAGSLTLQPNGRFVRVINGTEYPGAYDIRGDTVALQFDDLAGTQTYRFDGAALIELAEPWQGTVWVKQGEQVPAEFRPDRYALARKDPTTYQPTLLTADLWLWANGSYLISFGSLPGRQSGDVTVQSDTLLSFNPRIVVINESEGVLKGDTLRIGALIFAKR